MEQLSLKIENIVESFIFKGKEYAKKYLLTPYGLKWERIVEFINDARCFWYESFTWEENYYIFFTSLYDREIFYKNMIPNFYYFLQKFDFEVFKEVWLEVEKDYFWDVIFWIYFINRKHGCKN